MRLCIGEYEIDIKARRTDEPFDHKRFNAKDTKIFLLEMDIAFRESADYCRSKGYPSLEEKAYGRASDIHRFLECLGCFRDAV